MSSSSRVLPTLGLATVLLLAIVAGAAAAALRAPVIHERFSALPCGGTPANRTTLQRLGCAEQDILRIDGKIDSVAKTVFSRLPDAAARRRFVLAARTWLSYRNADCVSRSDLFEGGSESPVLAAQCMAARDRTHLSDLRTFARDLAQASRSIVRAGHGAQ